MTRSEPRLRVVALALSTLAGFVDGSGFVLSRGLFVSFMSGNLTHLGVSLAVAPAEWLAAVLIAAFVAGVIAGSLAAAAVGRRRKFVVSCLAAALLASAACFETFALPRAATTLLAVAMGALNNVFLREGEVSIPVTYMTGTLVHLGQRLAARLRGEKRAWLPYFALWMGLVVGAIGGGLFATRSAGACLWVAAAACMAIALFLIGVEAEPHGAQRASGREAEPD